MKQTVNSVDNVFFSALYMDNVIGKLHELDNVIGKLHELLDDEIDNAIISESTYINDQAPSVQIHIAGLDTFLLFLPNSLVNNPPAEQYSTFNLMLNKDYSNGGNVETFLCLGEVCQHLIGEYNNKSVVILEH
jgi:hypothetical protein